MKTKLTLTVDQEIVEIAKQKAASRGISLSKMFKEVFAKENPRIEKTPEQLAASRFLKRLKDETPIKAMDMSDK
jgi:hypothetical protein